MKNPAFVTELNQKLGAPSNDVRESLRLLKAFLQLSPGRRAEVTDLIERLATGASSDHPLP